MNLLIHLLLKNTALVLYKCYPHRYHSFFLLKASLLKILTLHILHPFFDSSFDEIDIRHLKVS